MIKSFKHKGLKAFYDTGSTRGVQAEHVKKLKNILSVLDQAAAPNDANLPGFKLHPLKGDRDGDWAITVRANWRVTFRFDGIDVELVDYEDYH
jgi:proteic killer suppression protein